MENLIILLNIGSLPFLRVSFIADRSLLRMQGLLEGGFSRITTLWIILIKILSYHHLAFL